MPPVGSVLVRVPADRVPTLVVHQMMRIYSFLSRSRAKTKYGAEGSKDNLRKKGLSS